MAPITRSQVTALSANSTQCNRSSVNHGASASPIIRQLRSRKVTIPAAVNATALPTSNVRPLESSNSLQDSRLPPPSGASTRTLEENGCLGTRTRNLRRNDSKSTTSSNVRTSRSQSARMTLRTSDTVDVTVTFTPAASTLHGQLQNPLRKSAGRVVAIKVKGPISQEEERTEVLVQNEAAVELPGCECGASEREQQTPAGSMVEHLPHCELYPHACPLAISANCQWTGVLGGAIEHITASHPAVEHKTGPNIQIPIPNWRDASIKEWLTLQTCLGQNFLVVLQKVNINQFSKFYAAVKIFGHQKAADRFEFRMALKKPGRTVSYLTVVRALHDGTVNISGGDSFVFDSCQAELFSSDESLVLDVSIFVTKI